MSRTYAVIAEIRGDRLRQVTFEALGAAAQMAKPDDRIIVLVIGFQLAEDTIQSLMIPGIDE